MGGHDQESPRSATRIKIYQAVLHQLVSCILFQLPLSIQIFPLWRCSQAKRASLGYKTEQSVVCCWQKKDFICSTQHPNIASYRLCAWPSFRGVKWLERQAFILFHLVLKMKKFWSCSFRRSPRTALPHLHVVDLFSNTLYSVLLLWEGSWMINHRQPAVCKMYFALRASTGLLQNVWEASDFSKSFGTTFWPHSKITGSFFSVEISANYRCISLGTNILIDCLSGDVQC